MTENKRFDYTAYDDGTESIYDRKKDEYYFDMQLSNIEELLNDLSDENEQLKQQLKTKYIVNKQYEELQRLKEENEQLKQALLFFLDVANSECSSSFEKDMEHDCRKLFNLSYNEAKDKYGGYDATWWELIE